MDGIISGKQTNDNGHARGNRGEWSPAEAHERAMSLPIEEVVKELVDLLELREEDEAAQSLPERLRRRRAI